MDKEQYKTIASLVGIRQGELVRDGTSPSDARRMAADEVGKMLTPNMTGGEVETSLALYLAKLRREKRQQEQPDAKRKHRRTKKGELVKSQIDLYTEWCQKNNWIGPDRMLAHFSGKTDAAYNYCRKQLERDGFAFAPDGNGGWNVEKPQPKPYQKQQETFTLAEVEDIIRKALSGR